MSFQDFASSKKKVATPASAPSVARPAEQTSELLLQYQRNVGILEKIVQSLIAKQARGLPSVDDELEMQFNAQVDVLAQLEQKLQKQLEGAKGTTWIKLQRDLERVQGRAKGLQESVARMRKNAKHAPPPSTDGMTQQEAFEYQQQLQLQEDRLNEEIMREREAEIRNINRGMHQVNEIFKDLAHIVGSQQEHIDNIETQMEDSRVNAESGLKQVEKANEKFGSSQCTIS